MLALLPDVLGRREEKINALRMRVGRSAVLVHGGTRRGRGALRRGVRVRVGCAGRRRVVQVHEPECGGPGLALGEPLVGVVSAVAQVGEHARGGR